VGAFTTDEILTILRGKDHSERAQAALELISRPAAWLPADPRQDFGNLAWYAERLPLIFHLYRRGWAPEQIGRKLTPLGGAWAVEVTLKQAAELIARRLNRRGIAA
jgi:hypothetical protein